MNKEHKTITYNSNTTGVPNPLGNTSRKKKVKFPNGLMPGNSESHLPPTNTFPVNSPNTYNRSYKRKIIQPPNNKRQNKKPNNKTQNKKPNNKKNKSGSYNW